jgi:hypothetical protein
MILDVGQVFIHHTGRYYKIVGFAYDADHMVWNVIHIGENGVIYTRTVENFVGHKNQSPRFYIADEAQDKVFPESKFQSFHSAGEKQNALPENWEDEVPAQDFKSGRALLMKALEEKGKKPVPQKDFDRSVYYTEGKIAIIHDQVKKLSERLHVPMTYTFENLSDSILDYPYHVAGSVEDIE